jgi:hypothetical protein
MTRAVAVAAALAAVALPAHLQANGMGERDKGRPQITCTDCHASTNPKTALPGAKARYEVSGHKTLGNSAYANGTGCQQCHTHEGFVAYTEKGAADPREFVANPSQPGCFTCHAPHERGDMSLRTTRPVQLANGRQFDVGRANLCASCHRAREDASRFVVATAANKIPPPWGAHHGPQADIVLGTNAYEYSGRSYGSSPHKDVINDACVSCHMSLPVGRASLSPVVGGHSFMIRGEVHENEVLNLAACSGCHRDVKQVAKTPYFSVIAQDDYDLNGRKEAVQLEVKGLLGRFVNDKGTGLLQTLSPPFYNAAGAFVPSRSEAVRPVTEIAALYNYKMILEDRSMGIHNAKYVVQILYDTIQSLDPRFDVSRRPR